MKRILNLLILILLITASCTLPQPPLERGFPDAAKELFILNSLAETLSVYDIDTGTMHNDAVVTGAWPNDIIYYQNSLYVVNSGDNSIWVYDESSLEQIGEIYLGKNRNPWTIIPVHGTSKAYVPNWVSGTVSIIDMDEYELIDEITEVGTALEGGCYYNGKLYVCDTGFHDNQFNEGSVVIIDTATDTVIARINTGVASNPQTAYSVEETGYVHVILSGSLGSNSGKILIIDTETDTLIDEDSGSILIGGEPSIDLQAINYSENTAYLSGNYGIMAYNYSTLEIINSQENLLYGSGDVMNSYPGLVYHNDKLYITDFNNDKLAIVDLITGGEILIDASDGPQELVFTSE